MKKEIKRPRVCKICEKNEEEVAFYPIGKNQNYKCRNCYLIGRRYYKKLPKTKELYNKGYNKDEFSKAKRNLELEGIATTEKLLSKLNLKREDCFCSECLTSGKEKNKEIEFHHWDYRFLDKITPLCKDCHAKVHKTLRLPCVYPQELFDGMEIPRNFKSKMFFKKKDEK